METVKHQRGEGTIDELPSGRFRVRIPDGAGSRRKMGPFDTFEEAERQRLAGLELLATGGATLSKGATVRQVKDRWLALKTERRPRSVHIREQQWDSHLGCEPEADWPIGALDRQAVASIVTRLQRKTIRRHGKQKVMSTSTVLQVFGVLNSICLFAVKDGLIAKSPCEGQELPEPPGRDPNEDEAQWLDRDEQPRLLNCPEIAEADRIVIGFAMASGIRAGELVNMSLATLRKAAVTGRLAVTVGSVDRKTGKDSTPKNGPRTVILVDWGIGEANRWLKQLKSYCPGNPEQLAFPTPTGARRRAGEPLGRYGRRGDNWVDARRAANITKPITWHSLRKTCASSLFSGFWGRMWTISEVARYLGDTEEVTAAYYARMHSSAMEDAARATTGGPLNGSRDRSRNLPPVASDAEKTRANGTVNGRNLSHLYRAPVQATPEADPADRDLMRDLLEVSRAVQSEIAAGQFSDHDCDAFVRTVAAGLHAFVPLLSTHARAAQRGPHRRARILDLARELIAAVRSLDAAPSSSKGRAS